jgi:hypothetical protein
MAEDSPKSGEGNQAVQGDMPHHMARTPLGLVWPLILKRGSTPRGSKLLSAREFIGWGIVIILIVAAVVFRW